MSIPLGVYRGRGCGIGPINTYESFVGRQVVYVLDFMVEAPTTWAAFETGLLAGTTTVAAWNGILGSRKLVLGVPACCMGTTWATEASGGNDAHWTALGNALVAAGLGNATLRIAREFNASWYPWKVTEANYTSYITGYRRIVTTLRAVANQSFRFCWNPYLGVGNMTTHGTEATWPGAAYVDEVGLDVYDGDWSGIYPRTTAATSTAVAASAITSAMHQKVWDSMLTQWDSIRGWYQHCLNNNRPLTFPEWGLRLWRDANVYHGGGDNAVLVKGMADFCRGMPAAGVWAGMWEDPTLGGMGVSDPDTTAGRQCATPLSRAAFLTGFA